MVQLKDYNNKVAPAWCPGCGNFSIWNGIKRALLKLELDPHQVVLVSGIGQSSKMPDYVNVNGFTTLHGRALPVATGIKLANHGLHVIVHSGDGDCYGIGGNHFTHFMRRDLDISLFVHDNRIYGLTKGQYSPTSPEGFKSKTSPPPLGALDRPVNPMAWALAAGATFVARTFAGDIPHMVDMMAAAISHKGTALLDIFQPCVIFNPAYSYDYYRPRVYKLGETEGYDPTDLDAAYAKAYEDGDHIPIGILYQRTDLPTYEERVATLQAGPLVGQPLRTWKEEDYTRLEAEFI
ncbi:MAG: 2-oxoacid:ferredoxin oxidoreductase subunit beta [Anaerolineae bacterium]